MRAFALHRFHLDPREPRHIGPRIEDKQVQIMQDYHPDSISKLLLSVVTTGELPPLPAPPPVRVHHTGCVIAGIGRL